MLFRAVQWCFSRKHDIKKLASLVSPPTWRKGVREISKITVQEGALTFTPCLNSTFCRIALLLGTFSPGKPHGDQMKRFDIAARAPPNDATRAHRHVDQPLQYDRQHCGYSQYSSFEWIAAGFLAFRRLQRASHGDIELICFTAYVASSFTRHII